MACPTCGVELTAEHSYADNKLVYTGHCQHLPLDHEFRRDVTIHGLPGFVEDRPPPPALGPRHWMDTWTSIEAGHTDQNGSGMKRLSILYNLPYWKV